MCSAATPDTQLFGISSSKTTGESLNNLQKQKNYNTENLRVPKHTLLKRRYQFVATVNIHLVTTK